MPRASSPPPAASALPARRRPRGLGGGVDHDSCAPPAATPALPLPRCRTSPSAAATRQSCRHLADHDPLTGLLNRRSLRARARPPRRPRRALRAARRGCSCSTSTTSRTSTTRSATAPATSSSRRSRTRCAPAARRRRDRRLGGDEFAMLLPTAAPPPSASPTTCSRRPRRAISRLGRRRTITASVGVASSPQHCRRGRARQRRPGDVRRQGGRPRPRRAPRRRTASRARRAPSRGRADPRALDEDRFVLHASRSSTSPGVRPQYELLLRMRDDRRRADPAGRVPAGGRALRPDPADRPLGGRAGDPRCSASARTRGGAASSGSTSPGRSTGDPSCWSDRARAAATGVDPPAR